MSNLARTIFGYLLVVFFFTNVIIQMFFYASGTQFDAKTLDHQYLLNIHGRIVYLAQWQHFLAGPPTWILSLLSGALWAFVGWHQKRSN